MDAPLISYPYHPETIQPETRALAPAGVSRILDLGGGCGGNGAAIKADQRADFLCVSDLSPQALARPVPGVDKARACDIEADGALETLFKEEGPFDLVLCLDVLEHLVDPWRAVARLHALLPPGGYLLASIPNIQNYRTVLSALGGRWRYRATGLFDRTHLRFFDRRSAVELMTCSGLELVGMSSAFGPRPADRAFDRASFGLLRSYFTLQYQVLVRRGDGEVRDPGTCGAAGPTA